MQTEDCTIATKLPRSIIAHDWIELQSHAAEHVPAIIVMDNAGLLRGKSLVKVHDLQHWLPVRMWQTALLRGPLLGPEQEATAI